jgi:hypothetical protein
VLPDMVNLSSATSAAAGKRRHSRAAMARFRHHRAFFRHGAPRQLLVRRTAPVHAYCSLKADGVGLLLHLIVGPVFDTVISVLGDCGDFHGQELTCDTRARISKAFSSVSLENCAISYLLHLSRRLESLSIGVNH